MGKPMWVAAAGTAALCWVRLETEQPTQCDEDRIYGHGAGSSVARREAVARIRALQALFVERLRGIEAPVSEEYGGGRASESFTELSWLRNGGANGGGTRLAAAEGPVFNRASVNVSAVHYEVRTPSLHTHPQQCHPMPGVRL